MFSVFSRRLLFRTQVYFLKDMLDLFGGEEPSLMGRDTSQQHYGIFWLFCLDVPMVEDLTPWWTSLPPPFHISVNISVTRSWSQSDVS